MNELYEIYVWNSEDGFIVEEQHEGEIPFED